MDAVLYVDEQKMPRLNCIDVHGELDIRRPKLQKGPFRHFSAPYSCLAHMGDKPCLSYFS